MRVYCICLRVDLMGHWLNIGPGLVPGKTIQANNRANIGKCWPTVCDAGPTLYILLDHNKL